MEVVALKKELRLRGYRAGGSTDVLRRRLTQAVREGPRFYEEASAAEYPDDVLSQSVVEDSKKAWQTYEDAAKEVTQSVKNPSDPAQVIRRWIARTELFKAADDPVDYFNLDLNVNPPGGSPKDLSEIKGNLQKEEDELAQDEKAFLASRHLREH